MKLDFLSFSFDQFATEMANLKDQKGFDYLVTIVGEDFSKTPDYQSGEPALGCIYILENTQTHERCSVKMMARTQVCGDGMSSNGTGDTDGQLVPFIPTVSGIWRVVTSRDSPSARTGSSTISTPSRMMWSLITDWSITSTRTVYCSRRKTDSSLLMTM